ncbi:glutathione S-transferase [Folsomia candida]|uniref:glutathione transferase n=1 Tax=Folsomia candida TaxID=158441 RepID=A0A226EN85_FOLCA|nr:glutathione S-transferase [Folsomia candida]OXA58261.1 Glutathione S-transferase [Folsomia candida]
MVGYKLTYWDLEGRGEPIRMLFAAANVKFIDNRISKESWPELKERMPWGQIPILEFDGKVIAQSLTICRYLAQKYNFAGRDPWESAKCDEYVDALTDLVGGMKGIVHAENDQVRATRKAKFLQETMSGCLGKFEELMASQVDSSFLVGGKLSWADIVLVVMLERLETPSYAGPSLLDTYPNLKMIRIAVYNYPGIQEWVENRRKK